MGQCDMQAQVVQNEAASRGWWPNPLQDLRQAEEAASTNHHTTHPAGTHHCHPDYDQFDNVICIFYLYYGAGQN